MTRHPQMEVFAPATPFEAWATAIRCARVADDGRLEFWSALGQRGGELRVSKVDEDFAGKVRTFCSCPWAWRDTAWVNG